MDYFSAAPLVTHPRTNRDRHGTALLIETNALSLSQTMYGHDYPEINQTETKDGGQNGSVTKNLENK